MANPVDPKFLAAWSLFIRAHSRVLRRLDEELRAECGVSIERFDVLMKLWQTMRPMQMHEVAESLFLSRSGATRFIDRLEEAGLVTRESIRHDRRGIAITLTPRGLEKLHEAQAIHLRGIQEHFINLLTADEVQSFHSAFEKILNAAETPDLADEQHIPDSG